MKACNACHIYVDMDRRFCPVCGENLTAAEEPGYPLPHNHYPDLRDMAAKQNIVLRTLLFVSILGCGVCLLVNLLVDMSFLWSLIVIAAVVYLWLSIPPLLRQGANYTKRILLQVLFTCALAVALDILTGYRGWSISYAVPGLLISGSVAIGTMVLFNRINWSQYVLYQVLMGLFGFIPLILYLTGLAHSMVMVIITASLSLASLLVTVIFGDRTIKTEFKRRFHL